MSHYFNIFGSRCNVLEEWLKSSRNDKPLTNEWVYKTDALNILFGERRQTKDINIVDVWAQLFIYMRKICH